MEANAVVCLRIPKSNQSCESKDKPGSQETRTLKRGPMFERNDVVTKRVISILSCLFLSRKHVHVYFYLSVIPTMLPILIVFK